jgi:transketolase
MSPVDTSRLMRDAFVETVCARARVDRDIIFVSADFGAEALDKLRADVPQQFVHAGICEQHMVDFGAGLALSGKKVILYAMAPFITLRCLEQVKCAIASMNLPITLVAVGVGLGYDHATLTHFTPEDLACMRSMNHIEVLSPGDAEGAEAVAELVTAQPRFRYVRLERQKMPPLYHGRFAPALECGLVELVSGQDIAILACGYMSHKAVRAANDLRARGIDAGAIDVFRVKTIDSETLRAALEPYRAVVTVEEQMLEGGFGSAIAEVMIDAGIRKPMKRLGIRNGFQVSNGKRDYLHQLYGIDVPDITRAVENLVAGGVVQR